MLLQQAYATDTTADSNSKYRNKKPTLENKNAEYQFKFIIGKLFTISAELILERGVVVVVIAQSV
jgi:hypothetical protein